MGVAGEKMGFATLPRSPCWINKPAAGRDQGLGQAQKDDALVIHWRAPPGVDPLPPPHSSRALTFDVELVRAGPYWESVGVLASPDDSPQHLVVDDVGNPSLVSEWNACHSEAFRVL